jgi:two-component system NarL family sensor kinase
VSAGADPRHALVAQIVEAEERARRRVAETIHDEPLQELLAAKQDLDDAADGDPVALERARASLVRAIRKLREAVFELHPAVVEHAGLEAALNALAAAQAQQGGFRCAVFVEERACGVHDRLLLALARELMSNVVKHANAREVEVSVTRSDGEIELEVRDDGVGIPAGRRSAALARGHIGLVASAERVESLGGELSVCSEPGRGTCVRARMPVDQRV